MIRPFTSHGYLLINAGHLLTSFAKQHGIGRVVGGAAGLVRQRDPDTVRGPDLAHYSDQRLPAGPLPEGSWPASAELVVEIRSESDRWKDIWQKVAE